MVNTNFFQNSPQIISDLLREFKPLSELEGSEISIRMTNTHIWISYKNNNQLLNDNGCFNEEFIKTKNSLNCILNNFKLCEEELGPFVFKIDSTTNLISIIIQW